MGGGLAMILAAILSMAFTFIGLAISPVFFNMTFMIIYIVNSYKLPTKEGKLKMINEAICHYMSILLIVVITAFI
jgi:hypothetical protein